MNSSKTNFSPPFQAVPFNPACFCPLLLIYFKQLFPPSPSPTNSRLLAHVAPFTSHNNEEIASKNTRAFLSDILLIMYLKKRGLSKAQCSLW